MTNPNGFDGMFKIYVNGRKNDPVEVRPFTRAEDIRTLDEFIGEIQPQEIGWDNPTQQLYYRDIDNKAYKIIFEEINLNTQEN